jgi:hypothetical protein
LPSIVIGRLNEPARVRPTFHQCVSSKLPWLEIDDDLPRFKESECRRLSPANVSLVLKSALAREAGESLADIARTYGVAQHHDNAAVARAALARGSPERPAPQSTKRRPWRMASGFAGRRKQRDDKGCDWTEDGAQPIPKPSGTAAALRNPTGEEGRHDDQKEHPNKANHMVLQASGVAKLNLRELDVN